VRFGGFFINNNLLSISAIIERGCNSGAAIQTLVWFEYLHVNIIISLNPYYKVISYGQYYYLLKSYAGDIRTCDGRFGFRLRLAQDVVTSIPILRSTRSVSGKCQRAFCIIINVIELLSAWIGRDGLISGSLSREIKYTYIEVCLRRYRNKTVCRLFTDATRYGFWILSIVKTKFY